MNINAENMDFRELNEKIKSSCHDTIVIDNCIGQRFIGSGQKGKNIIINGIPGNALGAYLDGCKIKINGNAQDATGDTMNNGTIIINGSCGDACGYAMRGGKIYIRDNAGYRAGIHMKQYRDKKPVIVAGGHVGSFLGEYLAGGIIIVLGMNSEGKPPIGNFCGTGMHGGKIFLRCDIAPQKLPKQVMIRQAAKEDIDEISSYIREFCTEFLINEREIIDSKFYCLEPDTKNPYKQLYTYN